RHPLVGLVVEVRDRAAARVDARRAGERRDRAGLVVSHLVDDAVERKRLLAQQERAAGDGRDEGDLVTVGERGIARGVLLVDRVQQAVRLVTEAERVPDLADGGRVDLALRPARPLAQAGEEAHAHRHAALQRTAVRLDDAQTSAARASTQAATRTPPAYLGRWRRPTGARTSPGSRSSRSTRQRTHPASSSLRASFRTRAGRIAPS